jgi:hypothetical protein
VGVSDPRGSERGLLKPDGKTGLNKAWEARRRSKNQGVRGAGLLDADLRGRSNTRPPSGGQVAQLVEQRTENPRVGGSIPPLATNPEDSTT